MPGDRARIPDPDALIGRLRPARRSDAPALLALKRQAYGKYVPRIDAEPQPMVADYALMIEDHAIWLIDHPDGAGLLAGLVLRAEHDELVVWSVAVAPAAQRQGLGGRLLAFAEAEARRAGLRQLRLFTNEMFTENLALYRRLGYHETGREDYRGRVLVHLHKPLDEPLPKLG
jgi:ribosomal protein S18 acetylase RimI-like enzyme